MKSKCSTVPNVKGGKSGVAPKYVSTGGASDGGGSKDLAGAARSINSPKKGGAPGV